MTNPEKKNPEVLPEERLGDLIRGLDKDVKLATAESCTGGLVASRITDIARSSDYFLGGVVAYSYELKESLLGVKAATLKAHGAVSEQVAAEMAAGVAERTGADITVSLTGVAGPSGGSAEKPVGTVYMGFRIKVADNEHCFVRLFNFEGRRTAIKQLSATAALTTLADFLEGL